MTRYQIVMKLNGDCFFMPMFSDVYQELIGYTYIIDGELNTYCMAKNREHAAKIANERRTFMIENNLDRYNFKGDI